MTCDDLQIAFEQLEAGAPAPISRAELEAHVAACAPCAAYLAVSRKVRDNMDHARTTSPAPLDLDAMRVRIAAHRRELRLGLVVSPLSLTALMAVIYHLHTGGPLADTVRNAVLYAAIFVAATLINTWRPRARLARLDERDGAELLVATRASYDRELSGLKLFAWFFPLLGLAINLRPLLAGAAPGIGSLLVAAALVAFVPLALVERRRLKRERSLLGA